ncbi:hypothetical protein [Methylobacterium sp. GC_Met_2]|uniref:hypothetical protein n=1 Tax=Methylobacterium sp. GC_Met_2 TaxID=2937376 RepID=UPI00226B7AB7|nr:hypothetical protein [Methylobacterium sp. GC_Met_2]
MPSITPSVAQGRHKALRAFADNPQGLPGNAYSSVMPVLQAAGLVTRRDAGLKGRRTLWFLTSAGHDMVTQVGTDELQKRRGE